MVQRCVHFSDSPAILAVTLNRAASLFAVVLCLVCSVLPSCAMIRLMTYELGYGPQSPRTRESICSSEKATAASLITTEISGHGSDARSPIYLNVSQWKRTSYHSTRWAECQWRILSPWLGRLSSPSCTLAGERPLKALHRGATTPAPPRPPLCDSDFISCGAVPAIFLRAEPLQWQPATWPGCSPAGCQT